jgi:hypothetical protein
MTTKYTEWQYNIPQCHKIPNGQKCSMPRAFQNIPNWPFRHTNTSSGNPEFSVEEEKKTPTLVCETGLEICSRTKKRNL